MPDDAPAHTPHVLRRASLQVDAAKKGLQEAGLGDVILGGNYVCGERREGRAPAGGQILTLSR